MKFRFIDNSTDSNAKRSRTDSPLSSNIIWNKYRKKHRAHSKKKFKFDIGIEAPITGARNHKHSKRSKKRSTNSSGKSDLKDSSSSEAVLYVQQEIDDPRLAIVQNQVAGVETKILLLLADGQQRLITFEIPREPCYSVQDLLESVIYAY